MDIDESSYESPDILEAGEVEAESSRDGAHRSVLGPRDVLEGKLTYEGHLLIQGRAEGEIRVIGDIEVAPGATVNASLEGERVSVHGEVQGAVVAHEKLTLGGSAKLSGDVHVGRLQVEDGASLNGNVRTGGFEQPPPGE